MQEQLAAVTVAQQLRRAPCAPTVGALREGDVLVDGTLSRRLRPKGVQQPSLLVLYDLKVIVVRVPRLFRVTQFRVSRLTRHEDDIIRSVDQDVARGFAFARRPLESRENLRLMRAPLICR